MLRCENVSVRHGAVVAVHDFDLTCAGGEIVAVVGANGAGKSSFMRAVAGHHALATGGIELAGERLDTKSVAQRVRAGLTLVAEGRQIWPELSVEEHLRLGWFSAGGDRRRWAERRDAMNDLFPRLAERRSQAVGTLSGGEQQMVVIARSLIIEPRVLLLDEPTLGLAPRVLEEIADALLAARSPERAVVIAEQNADFALSFAERAYVLEVGRCSVAGTAAEIRERPDLVSAYLAGAS
jgi:branched-chain amino acid transport system ATP-binding protein